MPPIRWASLLADASGEIDYVRVRSLISVVLALAGGALMVSAGALEIWKEHDLPTDHVLIAAAALVIPLTGGRVADGIAGRLTKTPPPETP